MIKAKRKNPHVGSNFEKYLEEQGTLNETTALALKRVLAWESDKRIPLVVVLP